MAMLHSAKDGLNARPENLDKDCSGLMEEHVNPEDCHRNTDSHGSEAQTQHDEDNREHL